MTAGAGGSRATAEGSFDARLLLRSEASGFVSIAAADADLVLTAAFGVLQIPYERISRLTRSDTGTIQVYAAGATVWIETQRPPDSQVLYALLERKVAGQRRRFFTKAAAKT